MALSSIIQVGKSFLDRTIKKTASKEILENYRKYYVTYYGGNPDEAYPITSPYHIVPQKRANHRFMMELLLEELETLFGDCLYMTDSISGSLFPTWPIEVRNNICKFLEITQSQLDLVVKEDKDAFLHFSTERLALSLYLVSGTLEYREKYII